MRIVSIGEILWDVLLPKENEGAEHLGGAPFNFAMQALRLGHDVRFVSAVGDDERGTRALDRVAHLGLNAEFIQRTHAAPTGAVTVSFDRDHQPDYTIHRPAAYDFVDLTEADLDRLTQFDPDWIYFGTLFATNPHARDELLKILAALPRARRFYDVNLRRDSYTPQLVRELLYAANVVKLNDEESRIIETTPADQETTCARFARDYDLDAIAITRGAEGCAALVHGSYAEAPAHAVDIADPIGAGDAFAAAFLHGIAQNWPAKEIAGFANRAGAEAAAHPGAI